MLNEKNSDDIIEVVKDIFQEISKQLNRVGLNVNLEELQDRYDDALKKIILAEEREKNCRYLSGEFKISALNDEKYQCSYALYFEDVGESYHALEAKTVPLDMNCLTEDFQTELRKGVMTFEIDEPKRNVSL